MEFTIESMSHSHREGDTMDMKRLKIRCDNEISFLLEEVEGIKVVGRAFKLKSSHKGMEFENIYFVDIEEYDNRTPVQMARELAKVLGRAQEWELRLSDMPTHLLDADDLGGSGEWPMAAV